MRTSAWPTATVTTSSLAAEVSCEAKGPGKFGKPVTPDPYHKGECCMLSACVCAETRWLRLLPPGVSCPRTVMLTV